MALDGNKIEGELTITALIEILERYRKEIGCDGKVIGSHDLKSFTRFVVHSQSDCMEVDLDSIEMNYMFGCSCPYGITFNFK